MLAKWEKREVYRWYFVNHLVNHFYHLAFRLSCQAIGIFTKRQKLAIYLSFLVFRHVRALFCEIANQSLYTSQISPISFIFDSAGNLTRNLPCRPLWRFMKIPIIRREWQNARWEKWFARWFTKCHLYTSRFSYFADIFSRSRQFDDSV